MAEPRRQRDFDEGASCTDEISDDEVEVYVWNSLLQSYVFCPEDDTVTVAVEVGAHATGEADAVDRLASHTDEPHIDNGSLINNLPSSSHFISSSQHALDIHPSPPLPPLHLQPDIRLDSFLPIIVEEPEIRHGVVYGESSRTSSTCSLPSVVSDWSYTSPHALHPSDWYLDASSLGSGSESTLGSTQAENAANLDGLNDAGYNRTFLTGLRETSRRLSRGIDTVTRKIRLAVRKLAQPR